MENDKFYSDWGKDEIEDNYLHYTLPFLYDITIKEGMGVLDVGGFGCGGLNTSVYLKQKGCNIDVINIDGTVKDLCDEFNVNFIEGNIFTYRDYTTTYDIILVELDSESQIKFLQEGHMDTLLQLLKPNGILLTHFTDNLSDFPEGDYWLDRKKNLTPLVEEFTTNYCKGEPIEDVIRSSYNCYYIGKDLTRPFMKWFKIRK